MVSVPKFIHNMLGISVADLVFYFKGAYTYQQDYGTLEGFKAGRGLYRSIWPSQWRSDDRTSQLRSPVPRPGTRRAFPRGPPSIFGLSVPTPQSAY
ncbi:hypothetical protein J6590_011484 [Homalodisca vitripennis]|nr:hypothetical protein J6590_011484 [Homalodisca vitripennis]